MKLNIFKKKSDKNKEKRGLVSILPGLGSDKSWQDFLVGQGYSVTADTAIKVAVVIRCADVVAKTMAYLGCNLYKETSAGKQRATMHSLYTLLKNLPNAETTAYEFWHMYIFNLMLTSGAYARIDRDANGFIVGLWNIPTHAVRNGRNAQTGERYIDVISDGKSTRYFDGSYMYTPGLRFNSDAAHDFVDIAADVLGLTMSLNGFAKDFFDNGSNMGGFLEVPGHLSEEAFKRFKDSWQSTYAGVKNQHKWAFLEDGAKATPVGKNPNEAQALESRKFQIAEVCRIMGVPPHKVFDLDRATFSNIEQQNIEYVQESIAPMATRLEQTIFKDLLTAKEQQKYFAKFNINTLLRGDIQTRSIFYNNMRQNGVFTSNDIRDLEDMDRIPDESGGNLLLVNGNMIPLTAAKYNLPKAMQKGGMSSGQDGTPVP